jgi:hypothetical protein
MFPSSSKDTGDKGKMLKDGEFLFGATMSVGDNGNVKNMLKRRQYVSRGH